MPHRPGRAPGRAGPFAGRVVGKAQQRVQRLTALVRHAVRIVGGAHTASRVFDSPGGSTCENAPRTCLRTTYSSPHVDRAPTRRDPAAHTGLGTPVRLPGDRRSTPAPS